MLRAQYPLRARFMVLVLYIDTLAIFKKGKCIIIYIATIQSPMIERKIYTAIDRFFKSIDVQLGIYRHSIDLKLAKETYLSTIR